MQPVRIEGHNQSFAAPSLMRDIRVSRGGARPSAAANYSYRSATIGSISDARYAGTQAAATATKIKASANET